MFIREYKQTNKKTGEVYIKHKLVASVRTDRGPRQRTVMPLGTLTVPRIDWKRLAHALECRITGQQSLLKEHDADLELLALKLVSNNDLSKSLEILTETKLREQEEYLKKPDPSRYVPIDMNSVRLKDTRSLGAELLCMKAWDMLGITDILKKLKFSLTSISLTMVLLFGRMISPGSESHTIEWFRKRSALRELPGISYLNCGNDRYYEVTDELYAQKDRIEDMLFQKERSYFPHTETTIYLYDITNTYLEGHGLNNALAARGHCKSKRYDCPLITLSLVVDDNGMPICSQIYKGNQYEADTMETMMARLMQRLYGSQIPACKPTVAMDRGIATDDNVKWLRENGYHYVVIKREDDCAEYRRQFEAERSAFECVSSKKSIYGDENNVYIQKEAVDDSLCRVLCFSEGKARKEKAIAEKKGDPLQNDIDGLRKSILKGSIKKPDKIEDKLNRILSKHWKFSANYEAALEKTGGKITGISLTRKAEETDPLYGCYVIETSHADMSAEKIWKLYMTLTRVENAFRSMKETLGMRPVYHQTADRSAAHLFVTVLAYHLLITIENLMTQLGDTRTWGTLRDVMSTLVRGTVVMRDNQGATYNIRLSGEPEETHQDILNKLNVRSLPKPITSKIDTL
ncbi:MAG: IS1634 family transposase [Firmicutes bacterium]|nr:IS1634 family transposase [Bacillota bacterium]